MTDFRQRLFVVLVALALSTPLTAADSRNLGTGGGPAPDSAANTWLAYEWGSGAPVTTTADFDFVGEGRLRVVDLYCPGDRFEVYDNGVLIGTTSAPGVADCNYPGWTSDPEVAEQDPTYSSGAYLLGPGAHRITIVAIVNPFESGGAAARYDQATYAVPTLSTWGLALLVLALGAGGLFLVRRRSASA